VDRSDRWENPTTGTHVGPVLAWLSEGRRCSAQIRPSRLGLRSVFAGQHTVRAVLVAKQMLYQLSYVPAFYLSNVEAPSSTPLLPLITYRTSAHGMRVPFG
jgi:hypothetical protein